MVDERSDRERILSVEMELKALRALLVEQRTADRTQLDLTYKQLLAQLTTLATAADKFALATQVEKNEGRLTALESAVAQLKNEMVPRSELQVRLDGVASRQETMAVGLQRLDQNFVRLSEEWTQEAADRQLDATNKDRKRTVVVGVIGLVIAALVAVPSFVNLSRGQRVVYVTPTTVTAPPPSGR